MTVGGGATNIAAGLKLAKKAFANQAFLESKCEILLLSDGYNNVGGDPTIVANQLKGDDVLIRCVGIGGSPCQVDEATLKSIASKDGFGQPLYRFIEDRDGLVQHFRDVGGLTR
jgi:Mg-chelatase subunit ChlD